MAIADIDMDVQQVSLGQPWCLILCLVSVWGPPWYDMYVYPYTKIFPYSTSGTQDLAKILI